MKKQETVFFIFLFLFSLLIIFFSPQKVFFSLKGLFRAQEQENYLLELSELRSRQAQSQWILNFPESQKVSQVVGYAIGSGGKKVFLDKGLNDSFSVGDFLMATGSLLFGKIEKSESEYSLAVTIFDPNLKIAARVQNVSGNVFNGIFYFDGKDFVVDFLPKEFAELEGLSFAETSGQDGNFHSGFFLGEVDKVVESGETNLKKAILKPMFTLSSIYQVFWLKNNLQ